MREENASRGPPLNCRNSAELTLKLLDSALLASLMLMNGKSNHMEQAPASHQKYKQTHHSGHLFYFGNVFLSL